jgi:transposase
MRTAKATALVVTGLTVTDIARRYRVGQDKVRGWIRRGELRAINTAARRCARPRFVVTAEALEEFEQGRSASLPPRQERPKHKKRRAMKDFFP